MQLSRKADYALRAVQHLSSLPKGTLGSINTIAEAESIPREFLAKILKDLTMSGVLTSYQGVHGGYSLVRKPQEMSFLDVIEAVDGPIHLNLCTETGGTYCNRVGHCPIHGFWVAQEKVLKRALAGQKFSKYAKRRR
jgi:Rrf2 family transcriptional regulator, iron-sulfur cluster assembly transcription factor